MRRTDQEILEDIHAEMRWDPRVSPSEFGVEVKDGVVFLTGVVTRQAKRTVVEAIVWQVDGVTRVQNDIEVKDGNAKSHKPVQARRNSFTWEVPDKKSDGQ